MQIKKNHVWVPEDGRYSGHEPEDGEKRSGDNTVSTGSGVYDIKTSWGLLE
jgi:hypothetical protein